MDFQQLMDKYGGGRPPNGIETLSDEVEDAKTGRRRLRMNFNGTQIVVTEGESEGKGVYSVLQEPAPRATPATRTPDQVRADAANADVAETAAVKAKREQEERDYNRSQGKGNLTHAELANQQRQNNQDTRANNADTLAAAREDRALRTQETNNAIAAARLAHDQKQAEIKNNFETGKWTAEKNMAEAQQAYLETKDGLDRAVKQRDQEIADQAREDANTRAAAADATQRQGQQDANTRSAVADATTRDTSQLQADSAARTSDQSAYTQQRGQDMTLAGQGTEFIGGQANAAMGSLNTSIPRIQSPEQMAYFDALRRGESPETPRPYQLDITGFQDKARTAAAQALAHISPTAAAALSGKPGTSFVAPKAATLQQSQPAKTIVSPDGTVTVERGFTAPSAASLGVA